MKFSAIAFLAVAATPAAAFGPATPLSVVPSAGSSSALSMVLEKPKKLSKLEVLKTQSHHLENPLREVRCFALLCFLVGIAISFVLGTSGFGVFFLRAKEIGSAIAFATMQMPIKGERHPSGRTTMMPSLSG